MTSTPFSVGLSDEPRLSSRVLRPPGGGHTDIFGSEPEPQRLGRRPGPNTAVPVAPKAEEPAKPTNGAAEPSQNGNCQAMPKEAPPPETPAVTPVTPVEPIKSDPPKSEAPKPEPSKTEPPKRVRVPPGGFSSGLW
ncbi:jupiter microtubule associated homolog 1-like [Battus philenor]|uniref:jupiter microtubule associated homolog 1-like n=1 Tax=Battus philenor TaxID=42288 RepID=UPI0035D09EC0